MCQEKTEYEIVNASFEIIPLSCNDYSSDLDPYNSIWLKLLTILVYFDFLAKIVFKALFQTYNLQFIWITFPNIASVSPFCTIFAYTCLNLKKVFLCVKKIAVYAPKLVFSLIIGKPRQMIRGFDEKIPFCPLPWYRFDRLLRLWKFECNSMIIKWKMWCIVNMTSTFTSGSYGM